MSFPIIPPSGVDADARAGKFWSTNWKLHLYVSYESIFLVFLVELVIGLLKTMNIKRVFRRSGVNWYQGVSPIKSYFLLGETVIVSICFLPDHEYDSFKAIVDIHYGGKHDFRTIELTGCGYGAVDCFLLCSIKNSPFSK